MKFNNIDLSKATSTFNPNSSRRYLLPDEKFAVRLWFREIAAEIDKIPESIFNDMVSIQKQFDKDEKLSDSQLKYIQDTYERYC